jgi:23S rRNA (pseudouridine1915-N3)-methyltransferase
LKIELLAAGTRSPDWVKAGVTEYQKRMPRECALEITEIAVAKRVKNDSTDRFKREEEKSFRQKFTQGARKVALNSGGKILSTEELSVKLESWKNNFRHVQMLIGGPDGLSKGCLDEADEIWSLSNLTFPHFLVRVIVAEQLYRAWSVLNNHPYHK